MQCLLNLIFHCADACERDIRRMLHSLWLFVRDQSCSIPHYNRNNNRQRAHPPGRSLCLRLPNVFFCGRIDTVTTYINQLSIIYSRWFFSLSSYFTAKCVRRKKKKIRKKKKKREGASRSISVRRIDSGQCLSLFPLWFPIEKKNGYTLLCTVFFSLLQNTVKKTGEKCPTHCYT